MGTISGEQSQIRIKCEIKYLGANKTYSYAMKEINYVYYKQ